MARPLPCDCLSRSDERERLLGAQSGPLIPATLPPIFSQRFAPCCRVAVVVRSVGQGELRLHAFQEGKAGCHETHGNIRFGGDGGAAQPHQTLCYTAPVGHSTEVCDRTREVRNRLAVLSKTVERPAQIVAQAGSKPPVAVLLRDGQSGRVVFARLCVFPFSARDISDDVVYVPGGVRRGSSLQHPKRFLRRCTRPCQVPIRRQSNGQRIQRECHDPVASLPASLHQSTLKILPSTPNVAGCRLEDAGEEQCKRLLFLQSQMIEELSALLQTRQTGREVAKHTGKESESPEHMRSPGRSVVR